jgi:hypothetical protein
VIAGVVVLGAAAAVALHRPPRLAFGGSSATMTLAPTPTGGIPTVVSTDAPHLFPTIDLTVVAGGTATKDLPVGNTPAPEPSSTP